MTGQVVMQSFLRRRIPLVVRRLVTLTPPLVISQVVLAFGIPFALIPLVMLSRRRDLMGALVNRRHTTLVAALVAGVITGLDVTLIVLTLVG